MVRELRQVVSVIGFDIAVENLVYDIQQEFCQVDYIRRMWKED